MVSALSISQNGDTIKNQDNVCTSGGMFSVSLITKIIVNIKQNIVL